MGAGQAKFIEKISIFSWADLAADANSQGSVEAGNGEVGSGNPHWECKFLKDTWNRRARAMYHIFSLGISRSSLGIQVWVLGKQNSLKKQAFSAGQILPQMQIPR